MTSKIFTPELMEVILNNLKNEFYSLYSCALVSRHWCKMSIPFLWQDPFSSGRKPSFISKYFLSLNDDEKFILKDHGINLEISKTLFNYAKFLKVLDLSRLEEMARKWLNLQLVGSISFNDPLIYHITNLLFKLFIDNDASLLKLHLNFSKRTIINPEIFCLLKQNEQCLSQLQDLSLGLMRDHINCIDDAIALLKILANNSTKVNVLKIDQFYSQYGPQIYRAIVCVINSQEQLKQLNLSRSCYSDKFHGFISALESQKQSLRELIINGCFCYKEFELLINCENLEVLRIRYCKHAKLLTLSDYKISTLEIVDYSIDASNIVLILEKAGTLLQRLKLESVDRMILEQSLLLKSLNSFCPNITYLEIVCIEFSSQLLDLIGNLQKLQFLILCCEWCPDSIKSEEEEKDQILQFAEILPLTLHYLDIRISCFYFYMDILLSNCYAPLKKLLIDGLYNEKQSEALIEFCIRKRTSDA